MLLIELVLVYGIDVLFLESYLLENFLETIRLIAVNDFLLFLL